MSLQHILNYKIPHKPILYSTPMVQAILAERKTQTRRIIKPKLLTTMLAGWDESQLSGLNNEHYCPYGQPGDLLWVRESSTPLFGWVWKEVPPDQKTHEYCFYKTSFQGVIPKMNPSIHMPKWAARIWLQIKSVRVERLQDISEEDAIAEGVLEYEDGTFKNYFTKKGLREQDGVECLLAKGSFQSLWHAIHGPDSWELNPWVWVIEYDVLSTDGAPSVELLQSLNLIKH